MRRFILGIVVTGVSVFLLVRLIDWDSTASALESANPKYIGFAVTCLLFSLLAKTFRWRLLLPAASHVTTPRLYRILHISFLLNNVLPARLGDVARVAMTSKQPDIRVGHVLSSLLTERVTDGLTLLTGFVLVSPFLPIPDKYVSWLHIAWYIIAGVIVAIILGAFLRRRLGHIASSIGQSRFMPGSRRLQEEAVSFKEGWRQLFSRDHVVSIWGWSWTAWLGAFAINYMLMRALHINAPITVAVLLTCTTNLAMLIPSSPGYIGVFHAAATLSLLPFNVAPSSALSFAILAHLVNVVPVSILGAAFLLWGRETLSINLKGLRRERKELEEEDPVVATVLE
ncbi:flippase-like domain-containing protein [bacterium]|nr:flippase-like domain-containing protein [bacterium]